MTDLADFLLARIIEDEAVAAVHAHSAARSQVPPQNTLNLLARRIIADAEAKRRIVKSEDARVQPIEGITPEWEAWSGHVTVTLSDGTTETVTEQVYRDRFTEPAPPSLALRQLATAYADHPDYRQEWTP